MTRREEKVLFAPSSASGHARASACRLEKRRERERRESEIVQYIQVNDSSIGGNLYLLL